MVDRYGISVSQMTTDMFHLSKTLAGSFLIYDLSPGTKHTTQWSKDKRTNNDLQNIQHNGQKTKGQTTIYKTYNTMSKRQKDKQRCLLVIVLYVL
jgi:hypothetical protein